MIFLVPFFVPFDRKKDYNLPVYPVFIICINHCQANTAVRKLEYFNWQYIVYGSYAKYFFRNSSPLLNQVNKIFS